MIISTICPKCGTMKMSGKVSCCGRGGSWFGLCGSAGKTQLRHTWHEGIQACKTRAQSRIVMGEQSNAAQQLNNLNGTAMANSNAVITAAKTFTLTSANTPISMPSTTAIVASAANASINVSDSRSIEHYTGNAVTTIIARSVKMTTPTTSFMPTNMAINTSARMSFTNTLAHMSMTAPAHTGALNMTLIASDTKNTSAAIFPTAKEATTITDWVSRGMCYIVCTRTCMHVYCVRMSRTLLPSPACVQIYSWRQSVLPV